MTERHIDRLWSRMSKIYGHRWIANYGDADDGTWLKGLADLAPEQLAHGLGQCLGRADGWPPTLPEFRRLCKPETPAACHRVFKALPRPRAKPELVAENIASMRAALCG